MSVRVVRGLCIAAIPLCIALSILAVIAGVMTGNYTAYINALTFIICAVTLLLSWNNLRGLR